MFLMVSTEWLLAQSAALVVALAWVYSVKKEKQALLKQNIELSQACIQLSAEHSKERVQREEHHMLMYDASLRNILASFERAATRKPEKSDS